MSKFFVPKLGYGVHSYDVGNSIASAASFKAGLASTPLEPCQEVDKYHDTYDSQRGHRINDKETTSLDADEHRERSLSRQTHGSSVLWEFNGSGSGNTDEQVDSNLCSMLKSSIEENLEQRQKKKLGIESVVVKADPLIFADPESIKLDTFTSEEIRRLSENSSIESYFPSQSVKWPLKEKEQQSHSSESFGIDNRRGFRGIANERIWQESEDFRDQDETNVSIDPSEDRQITRLNDASKNCPDNIDRCLEEFARKRNKILELNYKIKKIKIELRHQNNNLLKYGSKVIRYKALSLDSLDMHKPFPFDSANKPRDISSSSRMHSVKSNHELNVTVCEEDDNVRTSQCNSSSFNVQEHKFGSQHDTEKEASPFKSVLKRVLDIKDKAIVAWHEKGQSQEQEYLKYQQQRLLYAAQNLSLSLSHKNLVLPKKHNELKQVTADH